MTRSGFLVTATLFAAWLGMAAAAAGQEVQPRAKTPPAPRAAPGVASDAEADPPTVTRTTPAPAVTEEAAAAIAKSGELSLARPDLRCLIRVRRPPAITQFGSGTSLQFDPDRTRFEFQGHVQNIGTGAIGDGVAWLKVRVNGNLALSQPFPFGAIKGGGMGAWEDSAWFEIDLLDHAFAIGYEIAAEMEAGVLTGPEELELSNNSCTLNFKVIRSIEQDSFQS